MSDLKNEYFLDESVNEDNVDIELIRLVKVNLGLWDKSSKKYSNILERDMAWESVVSLLPIEMTGTDAAKRFRTLQTTFGRYYKKVRESQPRSDAGSNWPIYQPDWPLYEELLFLIDVIKPRLIQSQIHLLSQY
ncbi:PREDICTED: uncharacterized protein LOC108764710 [Trachymyrmex cornetzi]|uniref:MADF domain-containing protein n=1 Tax=Trachymyrmex cornetzi TaxID=471704 RepID=A0A151J1L6_9HYME|nr:PREDICTED: uncharacterized protein LOC108764710 [Trachymyrmex cornetzi]KYN15769.1 hypothetical protein ALC57_12067 [Trachymyrmex cornetzi]